MKLSTKISISLFFSTVAILFVGGLFIYSSTHKALQDTAGDAQQLLAIETVDKVDRFLFERYLDIQTISGSTPFIELISRGGSQAIADERLRSFSDTTGPWDLLTILDTKGLLRVTLDKNETTGIREQHAPELEAFKQVMATGMPYYSDALIAEASGKPSLIFAAPVIDDSMSDGRIVGVAIGQMSWAVLQDIIGHDESRVSRMHNNKGQLIVSSDKRDKKDLFSLSHLSEPRMADTVAGRTLTNATIENSKELLISTVPELGYLSYKGNGWSLEIEVPASIAFASARSTAFNILLVLIPILIIGSVYILFLIFILVVKPINALAETSKKIAAGDLSVQAEVSSRDEVGLLAEAFNTMTGELQASYLKLKLAKEKDEIILSSVGDGLLVVDADLQIVVFNAAAEKICGFSQSEAIGKKYSDILHFVFEGGDKVNNLFIKDCMETGLVQEMANHTEIVTKSGTRISVADSAAPIKDEHGIVVGCVVVFRDVTKERDLERSKDEFLSIASHQLKTPLGGMRWNLEMIADEAKKLPENIASTIELVYKSDLRLIALVNDLLNVSRINQGKIKDSPQILDCIPLVQSVITDLVSETDHKKITIRMHSEGAVMAKVDSKNFYQVMQNLLTNAVKYSHEHSSVEVFCSTKEQKTLIRIVDTGVGIPSADQQKLFEKFYRASNAIQMNTEGSGLGLFVVKFFVELWGGKIWLETVENKGTTFFVELPSS